MTNANKPIKTVADALAYLAKFPQVRLDASGENVIVTHECPRCWGIGHYSFTPSYGSKCFECHGRPEAKRRTELVPAVAFARKLRNKNTTIERKRVKRLEAAAKREAKKIEAQRNWCEKNGYGRITFEELDAERKAEREAKRSESQHVGTVGERVTLTLKVLHFTCFDGAFGTTYVHIMADEHGNAVVYKGSARLMDDDGNRAHAGDTVTLKATVKGHGDYKGQRQTMLARPKVVALAKAEGTAAA